MHFILGDEKYNFPNVIPMKIPHLKIVTNSTYLILENAELHGLDTLKVLQSHYDDVIGEAKLTLQLNSLHLIGRVVKDSRILDLKFGRNMYANFQIG